MIFGKKYQAGERPESLSRQTWLRFKKNGLAMTGLLIIVFAFCVAVLGYLITPDQTPFANNQKPEMRIKEPGYVTDMLLVRKNSVQPQVGVFYKMFFGEEDPFVAYPFADYEFAGPNIMLTEHTESEASKPSVIGFNMADVVFALDPAAPLVYDSLNKMVQFKKINAEHVERLSQTVLEQMIIDKHLTRQRYVMGTDLLGRDLLSRLMIGTRISLTVGLISVVISIFIGILLGCLAGYFRGSTDVFISWLINVVWSIPTILLVIAITLVLGKGIMQVFIAVGLTMWVDVARVVRGQILSIREKEFVEAGRALGFQNSRIIFRHILPNVLGPVIVMAASNFASAILMEAGLSFLGLGAQPPMPSWGEMINAHRGYILMDKAYLAFIPGAAIMTLVLAFMMVGNGLRDAMDTRLGDSKPIGNI